MAKKNQDETPKEPEAPVAPSGPAILPLEAIRIETTERDQFKASYDAAHTPCTFKDNGGSYQAKIVPLALNKGSVVEVPMLSDPAGDISRIQALPIAQRAAAFQRIKDEMTQTRKVMLLSGEEVDVLEYKGMLCRAMVRGDKRIPVCDLRVNVSTKPNQEQWVSKHSIPPAEFAPNASGLKVVSHFVLSMFLALMLAFTASAADSGAVTESEQIWNGRKVFLSDVPTTTTLTGAVTLVRNSTRVQRMNPGGASRNVTLPANDLEGWEFFFVNTAGAAENLVIKNAAGTTIVTVEQNQAGFVWNASGAWTGFAFSAAASGFIAASGATDGATSQNQVFTNGVTTDEILGNTATPLVVVAKAGSSAVGNAVSVTGGAGNGAFDGGAATLAGGASGAGATGAGGAVAVTASASTATNGAGGAVTVTAGAGNGSGNGGANSKVAGAGGATGAGGTVTITAGRGGSTSGASGLTTIAAGAGGAATTTTGGVASLTGGGSGTGATGNGGASKVVGGAALSTDGTGGTGELSGGVGTGTGLGGAVLVTGGLGGATNAVGGAATFAAGAGQGTGAGAIASITGGGSGAGATGNGGISKVVGGASLSTNGSGGAAQITGGVSTGTGTGGAITIASGASVGAGGTAGSLTMDAGDEAGGTRGTITIGGTEAGAMTIGRTGQTVTFPGTASFTVSPAGEGIALYKEVSITNAQMLDLADTAVELIAAPGAGKVIEIQSVVFLFDYTAAYVAGAADDLDVCYTSESNVILTGEATGFVDAVADDLLFTARVANYAPAKSVAENAAIVLANDGADFTGGNAANAVRVKISYRLWSTGF